MGIEQLIDRKHIVKLLETAGESCDDLSIGSCKGGGNNRVFIVSAAGRRFVVKWYFSDSSDSRDRLGAEYAFLEYALKLGLTCIPEPLNCLNEERIALYEFIDGSRIKPGDVSIEHINTAANFFLALNHSERLHLAQTLPKASDAFFNINGQISSIRQRIEQLLRINPNSSENIQAVKIGEILHRNFEETSTQILKDCGKKGINPDVPLNSDLCCVSPSDFGFHNALLRPDGTLCFVDFEYSGWDDPAKMACDFFCQPAVPVDIGHFEMFLRNTMSFSPSPDILIDRARIMYPLFQIKWGCIMLNEFLPKSAKRRLFATSGANLIEQKRRQLVKVQNLCNRLFV
jgi:thiamine kinase-like enzyme